MPEQKDVKKISRASLLIAANLLLTFSFIVCKLIIIARTGTGSFVYPYYYFTDIFVAVCLSFLVCISLKLYLAAVSVSLFYYLINCHLAMVQGFFFDMSALPLLGELGFMRDSILASVQYDIFLIVFALIFLNIFLTKRLSRIIENVRPGAKLFPVISVLLVLLVLVGRVSGKSGIFSKNPLAFLGSNIAINILWAIDDMKSEVSLDFDYSSDFKSENPQPPSFKSIPKSEDYNLVVMFLESTGSVTIGNRQREVMPNFNNLCSNGIYFSNFYAPCPISIKSIFSLHAGQYAAASPHAVTRTRPRIPLATIAEPFKERGYRTALLHGGFFGFSSKHKFLRSRGYDVLFDAKTIPGNQSYAHTSWGVDDRAMYEYARKWISQDDAPFMITFIPILPHHPYDLPEGVQRKFKGASLVDKYLSSVYFQDQQIGEFVEYLKAKGRFEKTVFLVVGDHAEAFFQHRDNGLHSLNLYEENVKVPLLISNPNIFVRSRRSEVRGSMPDLFPTVLDLFGFGGHICQGDGLSLFAPRENRMLFYYTPHKGEKLGLRDGDYKFIYFKDEDRTEMYDLGSDENESVDISSSFPDRTTYYKKKVNQWRSYTRSFIKNYEDDKVIDSN